MKIPKGGVAFFDSGIGGLTVMAACRERIQEQVFYYYGDNKHAPYGNLTPKKIRRFVFSAFKKFKRLRVKAVVLACNTATAVCIEELRKKYTFPIIGTEPAVYLAAKSGGEIWVLSTRATYNSIRLKELCQRAEKKFPQANVKRIPCDRLAGAIERHVAEGDYDYTAYLPRGKPSAVVLGCTHYPYIEKQIRDFYLCPVYHGNEGIAKRLEFILKTEKKTPLEEKQRFFLGRLTTFLNFKEKKPKNTRKNAKKVEKSSRLKNTFFLGKQRDCNEKIYKQMFAFIKSG